MNTSLSDEASTLIRSGPKETPFQRETFCAFIGLLTRLLYDDAHVVLMDVLAREQKAFTESDLREFLGWRETFLHSKLYFLEKQLLVAREQQIDKGPKSPTFWRIHPLVIKTVQLRLESVFETLQNHVQAATAERGFTCTKCSITYSTLDAATGPRALDDEHPLCRECGSRLCLLSSEAVRVEAENLLKKAQSQLRLIEVALAKVQNMEVPIFPVFTRALKAENLRERERSEQQALDAVAAAGRSSNEAPARPALVPLVTVPPSIGKSRPSSASSSSGMGTKSPSPGSDISQARPSRSLLGISTSQSVRPVIGVSAASASATASSAVTAHSLVGGVMRQPLSSSSAVGTGERSAKQARTAVPWFEAKSALPLQESGAGTAAVMSFGMRSRAGQKPSLFGVAATPMASPLPHLRLASGLPLQSPTVSSISGNIQSGLGQQNVMPVRSEASLSAQSGPPEAKSTRPSLFSLSLSKPINQR